MLVSWFLKEASVTGTRRLCHLHSYCVSLHLWFSVPPYIWLVFLLKDIRQKETTSAKEDVFYLEICQCNQFVKWVHPDYRVLDKIKPLFYRPQICLSEGLQRIQLQARGINPGCYVLSCTLSLFYSNSWTATTEKTLWFLIFCPLHFLCMQFSVNSLLDSIEQAQSLSTQMSNCHNCDDRITAYISQKQQLPKVQGEKSCRDPQHKPHRPPIYEEALTSLQHSSIKGMSPDFFNRL